MIDIQMFINLYQSITGNVRNKTGSTDTDSEGNCPENEGDRRTTGEWTDTGCDRRIAEQEAHERRGIHCIQGVYLRLRKGYAPRKPDKGTCIEEGQGNTRIISIPSFLFSYSFIQVLQSIDDICMQINPYLLSYLLQTYPYIRGGV